MRFPAARVQWLPTHQQGRPHDGSPADQGPGPFVCSREPASAIADAGLSRD
jgi:hypothetical protein